MGSFTHCLARAEAGSVRLSAALRRFVGQFDTSVGAIGAEHGYASARRTGGTSESARKQTIAVAELATKAVGLAWRALGAHVGAVGRVDGEAVELGGVRHGRRVRLPRIQNGTRCSSGRPAARATIVAVAHERVGASAPAVAAQGMAFVKLAVDAEEERHHAAVGWTSSATIERSGAAAATASDPAATTRAAGRGASASTRAASAGSLAAASTRATSAGSFAAASARVRSARGAGRAIAAGLPRARTPIAQRRQQQRNYQHARPSNQSRRFRHGDRGQQWRCQRKLEQNRARSRPRTTKPRHQRQSPVG